jgi:hypothetical protein
LDEPKDHLVEHKTRENPHKFGTGQKMISSNMNTSEKASAMMGDDMSVISNGYSTDEGIGSSVGDGTDQLSDSRDEVKEVHKRARKETTRVRMGKLLVLLSILVTAAIVSAGTYILLKKEEDNAYEDSVSVVPGALLLRLQ